MWEEKSNKPLMSVLVGRGGKEKEKRHPKWGGGCVKEESCGVQKRRRRRGVQKMLKPFSSQLRSTFPSRQSRPAASNGHLRYMEDVNNSGFKMQNVLGSGGNKRTTKKGIMSLEAGGEQQSAGTVAKVGCGASANIQQNISSIRASL